jgi:hypothetical protein
MTEHVQDIHGIFKAIAEMKLCGTAKLIAITIELHQTTDVAELMTLTGESRRIVQMYRASYLMARETRESSEKYFANFAKDAKPVSPLARVEDNNINTNPIIELVEVIPPIVPQAAKPAEPKRRKGTYLPEDFVLPVEWSDWTRANCPASTPERLHVEALKFTNHWQSKPGAAGRKLNWFKTWQNWCLTAFGSAPARPNAAQVVDWREAKRESDRQFMRDAGLMP